MAIAVDVHVERNMAGGDEQLGWWTGWKKVVEYRNKVQHFDAERWPIYGDCYWDVMGPLLHDCLVEL